MPPFLKRHCDASLDLPCGLTALAAVRHWPGMESPDELLEFAKRLAACARRETLPRFHEGCAAADKGGSHGFDPVTEADRGAERAMRAMIGQGYPDHGISGEEFADVPARGPYRWSLDPIDGTRSFTCGLPTWVTLIALLRDGEPLIGLIDAPCLDELYWGRPGDGGFVRSGSEDKLKVSGCKSIGEARLATTDPYLFAGGEAAGFDRIRRGARTTRYGHDGYAYARLAAGSLDLVVETMLKPHDYDALIPVVRAAGGTVQVWREDGEFCAGTIIAAASETLFDAALALMRGTA